MPTAIRMYDCAFGDCFRITYQDETQNSPLCLYVDFGIHRNCTGVYSGWKKARYDYIIGDMPENADFLLAHYHCDHYAGVLHMITSGSKKKFRNIYIPDVWGIDGSVDIVQLLLLRDLFTPTVLTKEMTLFRFLISICHATGHIYFVKRGQQIQGHYTALWPLPGKVQRSAARLVSQIMQEYDSPQDLFHMAEELCELMLRVGETSNSEERRNYLAQLEEMEQRFSEMTRYFPRNKHWRQKLADFEHRINIIFHSNPENCRKILFTGDAEGDAKNLRMWRFIERNRDGCVEFYEHYDVIKIPHHGTEGHYHDFSGVSDSDTTYLIPNGQIVRWPISPKYSNDANAYGCSVCCSNDDACAAYAIHKMCSCHRGAVISHGFNHYIDV